MVKFDLVLTNGKIHVETIDDAEATPGASRQYTRFNEECKPELEKALAKLSGPDSTDARVDTIMFVLAAHYFEKQSVEHIKDADGNLTNRIRVVIESMEP